VTVPESTRAPTAQAVLVCGLGRMGRQCLKALRGYHVPVHAIDLHPPSDAPHEFDPRTFTQGDFRDLATLQAAGIADCRSIVLLASDPAVNIEGAFAARRANPEIRLVVRAQEHSWHELLAKRLGNLVVYEPNRLSAASFAFSALDTDVLAHFYVEDNLFQVFEHEVQPGDAWLGQPLESIHPAGRQVLLHSPAGSTREDAFYSWDPQQKLGVGDQLLLLSRGSVEVGLSARNTAPRRRRAAANILRRFVARPKRKRADRPTLVALTGLIVLASLVLLAGSAFAWGPLQLPLSEGLRVAIVLLSGGHLADVVEHYERLPDSIHWMEAALVVCGTVLTAVLYALLTDLLLKAHFDLLAQRPDPARADHVIVAGLGDTGERIAQLLEQLKCKVVMVEKGAVDAHVLPSLPLVVGSAAERSTLLEANVSTARGLVAATANDQLNVEIALLASTLNPACRVAVRTFDPRFSENVAFLLPHAKVLCVSSLAATAYAAAALGEHVIHLFETSQSPVLVVEYRVTRGDTLVGKPLWEVAEGYSVVPVLHQHPGGPERVPTPDDFSWQLRDGDKLIVLATATSLEAIERGDLRPREYELCLDHLRPYAESLQIVGMLAQRLGYTLEQARAVLDSLPQRAHIRLYGLYASRTARLLSANGVETRAERIEAARLQPMLDLNQ
jgi:Trk K+ transport system NAD-binding subunit